MVITIHGDGVLMVHFSEPEMHPVEGSSKRQRWQVRTSGTGAGEAEDRRAFPTAKPTMTSTPTSILAFMMEFWGEGQSLGGIPKPHFPVTMLLDPELQGGFDSLSRSCRCRAIFLGWGRKLLTWLEDSVSSPTRSGSCTWEQWPRQHLGLYPAAYLCPSCPEKIYSPTSRVHGSASVSGTKCCPLHTIELSLLCWVKNLARDPGAPAF